MKRITLTILIALTTLVASCQFRSGDGQKYTAWNLGIKENNVDQTAQRYAAGSADGTESFRETAKTTRFGLGATALTRVAKSGFSSLESTTNAKTAADITNAKTAADVTNAKTAADVTKHGMTLEAEAAQAIPGAAVQ